jgi:hypothetical protein
MNVDIESTPSKSGERIFSIVGNLFKRLTYESVDVSRLIRNLNVSYSASWRIGSRYLPALWSALSVYRK